jgi:outer membrane receptor protein involved in Fe transport
MYTNSKIAKAVRIAMMCGAGAAATISTQAFSAEENGAESVERIEVTGSRIKRANIQSTSPVTTITAADIKVTGVTRVEDLLNDMPAIFADQTSGVANGATGTATVDLRNLGAIRTLTLMNGRRLPSGSPAAGGSGADVNQIPAALVERIEVLTGGASATYGSDAIAGVVNFIMKDDFEGFQFEYQKSLYQHNNDHDDMQRAVAASGFDLPESNVTDGDSNDFSIVIGGNTADGNGNVTLYATYRDIKAITQDNRDYSACAMNIDGTGQRICGGSSTLPQGRFTDFGGANDGVGFDYIVQGNDFVQRQGELYNYGPLNYFQRPDKRKTFGGFAHYEINEHVEVYTEASYMDDRSVAQIAPSGAFFVTDSLNCDNPLMSAQQFDAVCGSHGLTASDSQTVYIGRRNVEGGPRQDDLRHTSSRFVLGARGDIDDNWSYDASMNFGSVAYLQTYRNELSITNIGRALNVVKDEDGSPVCQSVLDGSDPSCVPWNVFQEGGVTQDSLDYLVRSLYSRGDTKSTQLTAFVSGDLTDAGFIIPGTTSGAGVVFGYEYRKESLNLEPDDGFTSGDGAGQGGPTAGVSGEYTVTDLFTELNLPLLEDAEFAKELGVELAYRYSDYSTEGTTDKSTDTYKAAVNWAVNDDVRFRASYQRAVRTGNIRELFAPNSIGLFNWVDPCGTNPTLSAEQCARTGVTAANYGSANLISPAGQYNSVGGGNIDLKPEKSDTISLGIILSPSFAEGLDITFDYFNIQIEDAIQAKGAAIVHNECAIDNLQSSCDLINRNPNSSALWVGQDSIVDTNANIGFIETSGIDIDASYEYSLNDMGDLRFNLVGTYLMQLDTQNTPGIATDSCEGYWDRAVCGSSSPKWRSNLRAAWITPWDATITATWRYFGEVDEFTRNSDTNSIEAGPTTLSAQSYIDLAGTWEAADHVTLRFGINNILDRNPPLVPNAPSGSGNGNTFPGAYDALGRLIHAGVTLSF